MAHDEALKAAEKAVKMATHMSKNEKGVWLDRKRNEPQGSMILWRYPNRTTNRGGWRLALAYLAKGGHYVDCGGMAGGNLADMTHFMEIPE